MKKSIKINLGGIVLHVDEDAYDLLRHYLDQIQLRMSKVPGEAEILNDIETRMAELFQEKLVPGKEVINLQDAREVIAVMGKPEEIGDTGEESVPPPPPPGPHFRGRRRIYRDPSNQRIAGVCSGLANYFRVDPLLIRILFVVFTLAYGTGILIYLALWVAVPEARTAAEKLEMYGEEVNAFNIERQVRSEYRSDPADPGYGEPLRPRGRETAAARATRAVGRAFLIFFKVIGGIIAFSFIIAGIALLGAIIGLAVNGTPWFVHSDQFHAIPNFNEFLGFFVSPLAGTVAFICLILIVAVPLIALIYALLRAIFRFKPASRFSTAGLSGIWVIALVILIVLGITEGAQYSVRDHVTETKDLTIPTSKLIIIKSLPFTIEDWESDDDYSNHGKIGISHDGDSTSLVIRPRVYIEYSDDPLAGISIRKAARGGNYRQARDHAGDIYYSCKSQDSVLVLDPVYRLGRNERYRAQEVDVTVDLPTGTRVYLDPTLKPMLSGVRNTEDKWSGDMVGKEWIMTPDGLAPVLASERK